jgi:SAM-dependent methyltransferase
MDIKDQVENKQYRKNHQKFDLWLETFFKAIYKAFQDYRKSNIHDSYWWFCGRKEFVGSLLSSLNFPSKILVLNAGCGTGEGLDFIKKMGNTVMIDINFLSLKRNNGVSTIQGDLQYLPFRPNTFDFILCLDVLEHIMNDFLVIKEFNRILKKAGICLISVPTGQFLYSTHDRNLGHLRRYSFKRFLSLFSNTGLKVIRTMYWNFFAYLPIAVIRVIRKFVSWTVDSQPLSDISRLPYFVNRFLLTLLRIENKFLVEKGLNFPFGISLFAIVKKVS